MNSVHFKSMISLLLIILIVFMTQVNAQEIEATNTTTHDTNLYMSLKEIIEIIDNFDYYSIVTPEELRQTAEAFKEISDGLENHIDKEDTDILRNLNIRVYESLSKKNIDMGEIHDLFEEIVEFAKNVDEGKDVIYIKRSRVIREIEEAYGTDQNLIVGYVENKERADSYITKAEVGTILYRIAEQNKKHSDINKKIDIPGLERHWSEKFLCNAYIAEVLKLDEDHYNVDEFMTKAELKELVEYFN